MARGESTAKVGYYPFGDEHLPAMASLFFPAAKPGGRIADFFAGEGRALQFLATAWKLSPYASELDQGRAAKCQTLFGAEHALHSAVEDLDISLRSIMINWCNPPYSAVSAPGERETHRVEDLYMRRTTPWVQPSGYVLWVIYSHHLTLTAARFLTRYCDLVDIWRIPGLHLDEYVQIVVVCRQRAAQAAQDEAWARALVAAGKALTDTRPNALVKPDVLAAARAALTTGKVQGVSVRTLEVQPKPLYTLPEPLPESSPFVFSSHRPDPQLALRLLQATGGAFRAPDFQLRNRVPVVQDARVIHPTILPRREHLPLLIAAGVMDGVILETDGKRYAVRANISTCEELVDTKRDGEGHIVERVYQTRTLTTVVLLDNEGKVTRLEGEQALAEFIEANREALLAHVEKHFTPLYDLRKPIPEQWRDELDTIRIKNHSLFAAQKAAVAAILTALRQKRGMIFVGEPGVGKTAMGASVIRLIARTWKPGQFALVTCPPHLVGKWQSELVMVIPGVRVAILSNVAEARQFVEAVDREPHRVAVAIVSREMAKLSERWEPCYRLVRKQAPQWEAAQQWPLDDPDWRERLDRARATGGRFAALWVLRDWKEATRPEKREGQRLPKSLAPVCPTCGRLIVPGAEPGDEKTDGEEKEGMFASGVIAWLNRAKRWCPACHVPLWTEARRKPDIRRFPHSHPDAIVRPGWSKLPKPVRAAPQIKWRADGTATPKAPDRNPRLALAQYVKDRCKGRIGLYVGDELHEGRNTQSAQGDAMMTLANAADKVLGLTGTLFSGLATGLYGIEYVFNEEVRARYPWSKDTGAKGESHQRWILDMGCLERVVRDDPRVAATGRASGKTSLTENTREAPGATPMLVATVIEHVLFMDLANLGVDLPPMRRQAIGVPLAPTQAEHYREMVASIKQDLRDNPRLASSYRQVALGWPNASFRPDEVTNQGIVYYKMPALEETWIAPKEHELIKLIKAQLAAGRRCVVFVRQSDTRDIQPRLASLLRLQAGANPFILKGSVDAKKRMDVYEREMNHGVDVVICNPVLVQTGLDLLRTPTLIFYELVDDLLVNQQAACRAWRIGQEADCEVYYLYYTSSGEPTMEHKQALRQGLKEIAARRVSGRGELALGMLGGKTAIDNLMDSFGSDGRIADPNALFRQLAAMEAAQAKEAAWFAKVPVEATVPAAIATAVEPAPEAVGIAVPALKQTTFWSEEGLIVPGKAQPLFDLSGYTVTTAKRGRRR